MHSQGWAQAPMSFCFACGSCPSVLVLAAARGVRPSLPSLRRTQCGLAYQPCCQLYLLCRPCCCAPEVTSVTGPLEQTVHLTSSLVNNALGARAKGQGKGQGEGQAEAEAQTSSAVGSAACARASASPCGRSRSRPPSTASSDRRERRRRVRALASGRSRSRSTSSSHLVPVYVRVAQGTSRRARASRPG